MKKFYLILYILLLFSFNTFSQIYSENFDGVGTGIASGVYNSGTTQPSINANLSVATNWTSYDHAGNLTTAIDIVNFCSFGKGLRGYSIPHSGSNRKFKLVLNIDAGYALNITSISYKHTSTINNGSSQVYVNGSNYGTNFLILQSCPSQMVTFNKALSLQGQVVIELVAGNSGTVNNAEFAFDDFNINGTVDFVANNEFLKQDCIGSISGVESRLSGAEIADFDGDNDKDIIASDDAGIFKLFKNNGKSVFSTSITPFTGAGLIASGDLDGDGDIDIAQSNGKIYLNNGTGTFSQLGAGIFRTSGLNIQNVKIADFNNDGKKDLLWLNGSLTAGENNEIWLNTGTTGSPNFTLHHSFDNVGAGPATHSAIGDIDNDNDIDIIACSGGGWNGRVYKNDGSGTFVASQTFNTYTGNGFLVDWDNDGDKDFLAYDGYNSWGLRLWKNNGTGSFSAPSSSSLTDVSVGTVNSLVDLNNDGYLDIACSNWGGYGRFILNSGCTLTPQSQALSNSSNGVRVADFNNDGKMDILCLARDSFSCIYLNYLDAKTNVPLPSPPSVSTPINYNQDATALALAATGTNLMWYTSETGEPGTTTAPTPNTATVGTTSYWVSQTNANGCESNKSRIDVVVTGSCLGGTGSQARLYNPVSADFDGDNDKDIINIDEAGNYWLYKNNGQGKFKSQQILNGLAWGALESKDLDNDNDIDLVSSLGKIFLNNGTGIFTELAGTFWTATGTISVARIGDFNKDGKNDILWLNSNFGTGYNNQLWLNSGTTGNPNFTLLNEFENTGAPAGGSVVGDIDKDGDIDLIICSGGGWTGKVFKNNGNGVLTSSQTLNTYTGIGFIVDWDKDGDNDFLAFDSYNSWGLRLWTNDGTGTFSAPSTTSLINPSIGTVRQVVDLNDDTYLDIVCSSSLGARYYLNTGCSLNLNDQVLTNANNGTIVEDFNNNGKKDIFCAARDAQSCLNLLNIEPSAAPVSAPSVSSPISYAQGATATALTAIGTNLKWYTTATGGTASTTALIPSTATVGTTSYWVSQTNTNGCESERAKIDVVVSSTVSATHLNFSNSYVDIGNLLPSGSSYTKEMWIKTGNITGSNILSSNTSAFWFWQNNLQCGHGGGFIDVYTPAVSMLNTWAHVAVTYDNASRTMKLYVNGSMVSQNTNVGSYTGANMQIGAFNSGTRYTGDIDEVRIWNTALSDDDILRRKNCELQGNETGLVAYYRFNQGFDASTNTSVTTLTDATSNGNNGTLNNFSLTGSTSNWLTGSPVTTGSLIPSAPTTTTPITYCQNAVSSILTASGTNLKWYTTATGGVGSATAPTPSTITAGTISYWVTSSNSNNCESERVKIDVIINSTPFAPLASTPITYCQNATASALAASGTNLKWYTTATGGVGSATAPTPSTITVGTISYWVISSNANNCESERVKIDVIINSAPSAPLASTPITYCQNATASVLAASGTNLKWYTSVMGSTSSTTALTPNTATVGTVSYWVSQSNTEGCESEKTKIDVIVNSIPTAPTASNQSFCTSATITNLTATGTNIKWYDSVTGGSALPSTTVLTSGTTYYASQINENMCESSRTPVIATINSTLSPPSVSTPIRYCQNATSTALAATGSNLQWYTTATGSVGSTTSPIPNTTITGPVSYWVSQSLNGCESERAKVDIVTNSLPTTPSVLTPIAYCQNITASALTATGTNLKWYTSIGSPSSSTAPIPNTVTVGSVSHWVSQTNTEGCESEKAKIDITINTLPNTPSITTPILYCQNTTANSLTTTGTNLKWYTSATGGTANTIAPTPNTTTVGTVSYWVSQTNTNGCESSRTKIDITINPLPTAPTLSESELNYCQGNTIPNLKATVSSGETVDWYSMATNGILLQNNNTVYIPQSAGTYYAQTRNTTTGCTSSQRAMGIITMNAAPSVPSISSTLMSYCEGSPMPKLSATVASGITVDWYSAPMSGTMLQGSSITYEPLQAGKYYAQSRNILTGCINTQRTMGEIVMNPIPSKPVINTPSLSYCEGKPIPSLTAAVIAGETVDWYTSAVNGTILQNSNTIYTPQSAGTYYAQSRNILTGCLNNQRAMGTISTNPLPLAPITSSPAHICAGSPIPTLVAQVRDNETVDWYIKAAGGSLYLKGSLTYTPTVAGIYYAEARNINTGCVSAVRIADTINIDTIPSKPIVQTSFTYCVGANAPVLTAIGDNLKWYTQVTGGISNTTPLQPNTNQEGTISYFVSQTTGNNCESPRSKIDVTNSIFKNIALPKQMTLCKDQYYVFNLKNSQYPILTHKWTSTNSYSSNKETDTLRKSGSYFVETLTPLGCRSKDTISLAIDTTTIESNFAVATELVTVDVIKVVNISSTQNDSIRWVVPSGLKIAGNTPALLELIADDIGTYKLGLITYKGACNAVSYQDITVYTKTYDQQANDSLYFVKTFTAYPNPNRGENLNVKIELSKESSVRLRLIELSTNATINDRTLPKADTHSVDYGNSLKKGSYILFLESPYGRNVLKIIVM